MDRRIYRKADEDQSGSQETELYFVYDGKQGSRTLEALYSEIIQHLLFGILEKSASI